MHNISSLLSFAATARGVLHHRLLKRECVRVRGGGRRHSSIAQRVLNGQNVDVSPFVRTALAQPAVFIVHRNCSASSSSVFCLGLLCIKGFFLPLGTRDKAINYSCLSVVCLMRGGLSLSTSSAEAGSFWCLHSSQRELRLHVSDQFFPLLFPFPSAVAAEG